MTANTIRTLLCLLASVAGPCASAAQQSVGGGTTDDTLASSGISGKVSDHESALGIPGALVSLTSEARGAGSVSRRGTNRDGRFFYSNLTPGTYYLSIDRFGYRSVYDTLTIPPGAELRIHAELSASPIQIDPIVVVVRSRSHPLTVIPGLEERERRGIGTFIDRKDIEQQKPFYVSDLLRMVPGVRVLPDQDLGYSIQMRGGCHPTVWVDGNRTQASDVDLLLRPYDIQQVEVYQRGEMPARFGNSPCGAVVFWTRTAESGGGHGSTWKKLLISAGLVTAFFIWG